MSFIRSLREESETIKFDNLFSSDLEAEREFDLIFSAEQDDEDLKTIAANQIFKEDGTEKEFDLPDCVYVNEDGELKDKDDEAGEDDFDVNAASSKDVEEPATEEPEEEKPTAPAVVVNVDADDVNINANTEPEETVKEDEGSVTVNAKVVNMTNQIGASTEEKPEELPSDVTTTSEPSAAPAESDDTEEDDESDVAPIEDDGDEKPNETEEIKVDAEVKEENPTIEAEPEAEIKSEKEEDKEDVIPGSDDEGAPTMEGVEAIFTASKLEDILNMGLEPAPAAEPTSPVNNPDDPSTEVVFSDNPDIEVKDTVSTDEAAEPTGDKVVVKEEEIEAVKNDENIESAKKVEGEFEDDLDPIADGDIEKIMNDAPEDEVKKELDIEPVQPKDVDFSDSVKEDVDPDPTEGEAPKDDNDIIAIGDPKHKDTSEIDNPFASNKEEDKEDAMGTVEDLNITLIGEADEDPQEKYVNQDAEDSVLAIEPSPVEGDLIKIFMSKDVDPAKNDNGKLDEAAEPTGDKVTVKEEDELISDDDSEDIDELTDDEVETDESGVSSCKKECNEAAEPTGDKVVVKEEEIEAVKNDENIESAKKVEGEFEDDLDPISDGDIEKIMNDAPEDEVKKELDIEPVQPKDVDFSDSVKEDVEEVKMVNSSDAEKDADVSPIGPKEVIPDEVNASEDDMDYDKAAAKPGHHYDNDGSDPKVNTVAEKSDYMDQVNALSTGENFADAINVGLNISPEEIEAGSDEELLDDEAIEFVEAEG